MKTLLGIRESKSFRSPAMVLAIPISAKATQELTDTSLVISFPFRRGHDCSIPNLGNLCLPDKSISVLTINESDVYEMRRVATL